MPSNNLTFPISRGIEGMNHLAKFLNDASLVGDWHFTKGSRFDQSQVSIDFDNPADLAPAWRNYRASALARPDPG
ncbi:hypothetical protein A6A04_00560 [Paramagnetospirillum marisnigri]|uniref:Uncharacterized protein n=1 Tax=Paramagnetospirillum marisnigri TaxID=1285242 RepID=A0A178MSP3_9PROT|nr:hypothetical protein [Paramagnetospirillum marisnigri]OAN52410.1 hypothetical protein A6A04_00560 [Paramagnetospirillum marisnigri]